VEDTGGRRWLGWETALGGLLLLLGIVVLLGQVLEVDLGRVAWPFFVIVPGLACWAWAWPRPDGWVRCWPWSVAW
jgi:hypothetical protein